MHRGFDMSVIAEDGDPGVIFVDVPSGIGSPVSAQFRDEFRRNSTALFHALQMQMSQSKRAITVIVRWASEHPTDGTLALGNALVWLARGLVQSVQKEAPVGTVRLNVISCDASQEDDLGTVLNWIEGPEGGYTAGSFIDLREGQAA